MSRVQIYSLLLVFLVGIGGFGYSKYREMRVIPLSHVGNFVPSASREPPVSRPPAVHVAMETQPSNSEAPAPDQHEARAQLANTAAEALNAATPEERSAALQQLASMQTPEVMYALGQGLSDAAPRNRHVSIDSLRLIAANQGDSDGAIREMLRQAIDDRDPEVASHARTAFSEVAELSGTGD